MILWPACCAFVPVWAESSQTVPFVIQRQGRYLRRRTISKPVQRHHGYNKLPEAVNDHRPIFSPFHFPSTTRSQLNATERKIVWFTILSALLSRQWIVSSNETTRASSHFVPTPPFRFAVRAIRIANLVARSSSTKLIARFNVEWEKLAQYEQLCI